MPTEPEDRVAAVVLAAGDARRFGAPKLLMPFGDSTIVGCVVAALEAAGIDPIIVVAGSQAPAIAEALSAAPARVVHNPQPTLGMLSSVRIGVGALPEGIDRFLLALADQPRISPEHIRRLLQAHRASGKGIAIPTYQGKRGHPVVFAARYRPNILALDNTHTLRDVIHSRPDDIAEIETASDAVIRDIDTREQYHDELRRSHAEQ
ncbi:MAG: nucleotidyltransferase family protein [Armatimonadetes bacterium]|nr:nucleotidyltransferase family protein [Armatimonadota bacterium]